MTFLTAFSQKKLFNLYLFLFFAALTFALYFRSLNNFYVLDDFVRLKAATDGSLSENFHFFPLPLLAYRLIYLIFGMDPIPLRILNYSLNAVMCVIIFRFSSSLLRAFADGIRDEAVILISFLASLLFCVHYVHVETIVYYSELHEMFYSVFYLMGLYFYLQYRASGQKSKLVYLTVCYLCCILSKETAVTFIASIFLSEIFIFKSSVKEFIKKYYSLLLITAGFAAVRYFFFSKLDVLNKPQSVVSVLSETIKNYLFSFTAFVISLDFTLIKDIYKNNNANFISSFKDIISQYPFAIAGIIISMAVFVLLLLKPVKVKYILLLFSIITISSFSWLAGYERYLYLPSVGFCILAVFYMFKPNKEKAFNKKVLYVIFALIIVYHIYSLREKESHWLTASEISRNAVTRMLDVTRGLPPGSKVYFNGLPGEYKSAWVLRYGIHEIPGLFLKRNDIKFYYMYQKPENIHDGGDVYVYDYPTDKLIKEQK